MLTFLAYWSYAYFLHAAGWKINTAHTMNPHSESSHSESPQSESLKVNLHRQPPQSESSLNPTPWLIGESSHGESW